MQSFIFINGVADIPFLWHISAPATPEIEIFWTQLTCSIVQQPWMLWQTDAAAIGGCSQWHFALFARSNNTPWCAWLVLRWTMDAIVVTKSRLLESALGGGCGLRFGSQECSLHDVPHSSPVAAASQMRMFERGCYSTVQRELFHNKPYFWTINCATASIWWS